MKLYSIANKTLKYSVFGVITLSLIGLGQLGQALKFSEDLRMHTINEWVGHSGESRKEIAEKFISTCLTTQREPSTGSMSSVPFSIYECGESIGAFELVSAIRESDGVLKTPAWPLSIID